MVDLTEVTVLKYNLGSMWIHKAVQKVSLTVLNKNL